jgi:hypothetical protein
LSILFEKGASLAVLIGFDRFFGQLEDLLVEGTSLEQL